MSKKHDKKEEKSPNNEETMKHTISKEDVKANPGEDLKEGEEIEIPVSDKVEPVVEDGAMDQEAEQKEAELSPTIDEVVSDAIDPKPTSPGTETEGSTETPVEDTKNAAGESSTKAAREKESENPH